MNEGRIGELLKAYLDAWKTHDIVEIGKHYAENVAVFDLPTDSVTVTTHPIVQPFPAKAI
jgi:ketosteroid isomerase-like protein